MDATEGMQGGKGGRVTIRSFLLGADVTCLDTYVRSLRESFDRQLAKELRADRHAVPWRDTHAWQDAQPHA